MVTVDARLTFYLNSNDKNYVARAADIRGVPVSVFVREAVLNEAEKVLAADLSARFSTTESRRFLAALDKVFEPSSKLKIAK